MNLPKKKLGIDFDDVLIDFMSHVVYYHNATYNTSLTRDDHFSFDLHEVWNMSKEEAEKRLDAFTKSDHHKDILPVEGAQESLKRLFEKYELIIITARDKNVSDESFHLIKKHFGDIFSSVHFIYDNGVKQTTKGLLAKNLGIDFFIDDSITNVIHTHEAGITTFLFDTPWNRDFNDGNIKRVHSWKEIEEILLN